MVNRFTDGMFVRGEARAEISLTLAQARLANLARAGWLLSASQGAYGAGATDLARADPPGPVREKSRLVNVHFRELAAYGDSAHLALRWEAIGPGGELFPTLDADIALSPAGEHATTLTLAGVYRPPPGNLVGELDQVVFRRVADATIQMFVDRIAEAIIVPGLVAEPGGAITDEGWFWPPAAQAP
jgi:hypothetical protein